MRSPTKRAIERERKSGELVVRDLYHRKRQLKYWKLRATELAEPDRADVLKLVEMMEERERSALWIIRCISALLLLRKHLNKPYRYTTKEDIKALFRWMDEKNYRATTHEKFRMVLKLFYKNVYGGGESYPDAVKWFATAVGHEKRLTELNLDIAEFLEESEINQLIEGATSTQKRAFLSCLYECGARPEEFLRLTNLDISIDSKGAVFILRGKTGERRVRIIAYVKYLIQWLELHPLRNQQVYPIWISEATNHRNKPLGIGGAEYIIRRTMKSCGIQKHSRLYILRHSRATHLAKHLTEAQLCVYFGWRIGSKVVSRYVHLSGRDVDNALLALNSNTPVRETYQLRSLSCRRCSESVAPQMKFCPRCSLSVDTQIAYEIEPSTSVEPKVINSKNEIDSLKQEVKALRDILSSLTIKTAS